MMKKLKKYLVICIGIILVLSVVVIALPKTKERTVAFLQDVFVTNTSANPVPILNINEKVQTPQVYFLNLHLKANETFKNEIQTIPEGKIFVAEAISYSGWSCLIPEESIKIYTLAYSPYSNSFYNSYFPPLEKTQLKSNRIFSASYFTKIYAQNSFGVGISRYCDLAPADVSVSVTGYLIDK